MKLHNFSDCVILQKYFLVLLSVMSWALNSANAQNIDLDKRAASKSHDAYFMLRKSQGNKLSLPYLYDSSVNVEELLEDENVFKLYEHGDFLLVHIHSPSDAESGLVSLYSPVHFKDENAFKRELKNKFIYGSMTKCHKYLSGIAKGKTHCLFKQNGTDNDIPVEANGAQLGRVRKILIVNDRLVMTTSLGYLIYLDISGSHLRAKSDLYLAEVPRAIRGDLVTQDLTRIYASGGLRRVVTGINGRVFSAPFGSKISSFDGNGARLDAKRLFLQPLEENWQDPMFQYDETTWLVKSIVADFVPLSSVPFAKSLQSNKSVRLSLPWLIERKL